MLFVLILILNKCNCENSFELKSRRIINKMKECDAKEAAMDAVNYIETVKKATTAGMVYQRIGAMSLI